MQIHKPLAMAILFLLPSFIFLLINQWKKLKLPKNLPPSPPKLPIIGHLHYLAGELPHHAFRRIAQKYGPIVHLQMGEVSTVLISSREAAKQVLKDQDPACADRLETMGSKIMWYNHSDLGFAPYGQYWHQMRKIWMLEMLGAKNAKSINSIKQEEVSHLINSLHSLSGESVNLTKKLSVVSSSIVCRVAFGNMVVDLDALMDLMKKAHMIGGGFQLTDFFPSSKLLNAFCWNKYKLLKMHIKLDTTLHEIVEKHKLKLGGEFGGEDVVDTLLRLQNNGQLEVPITDHNIKGVILDMFTGGTETSSATIGWAMAELMCNPRIMAKVQKEVRETFNGKTIVKESHINDLTYLKMVIKETFRLHPPVAILPRVCREECRVDGYLIPPKCRIVVDVWSMGRDPKYWDDPETFLPERFENASLDFWGNNFEFLPFGAGKRICPAINFGLKTIELTLSQLLYHFDWKLPEGMMPHDLDMIEADEVSSSRGFAASRKNDLFLVPLIYNTSNHKRMK